MISRSRPSTSYASQWGSGPPPCTAAQRLAPRLESLEVARARLADELGLILRTATAGVVVCVMPLPPSSPSAIRAVREPAPTAWTHIQPNPRFRWSEL